MIISDDTKLQQSVQLYWKYRTVKYEALQNSIHIVSVSISIMEIFENHVEIFSIK